MIFLRRQILIFAFMLSDIIIMAASAVLIMSMVGHQASSAHHRDLFPVTGMNQYLILSLCLAPIWHLTFNYCGLYHSKRLSKQWREVIDIVKATAAGTLLIYVLISIVEPSLATHVLLAVFFLVTSSVTILVRLSLRFVLKQFRLRGRNLRHLVIIGTNARAIQYAEKIKMKPERGYNLIGFIDDKWHGLNRLSPLQHPIIANLKEFSEFIRGHVVDEVVVCLPMKSFYDQYCTIVKLCEEQGIIVRFLSDIVNLKNGKLQTEQFEDFPIVTVYTGALREWEAAMKRIFDFVVSVALIILLFPVFLMATLLIKSTSPGPVFFSQERLGFNKRRFRLYKFRTMIPNAERLLPDLEHLNESDGPAFKIKDDPRVTSIGKILRKTSIDELPQLFNVLKGDLSLVGPRPLPVRDYEGFSQDRHRRRFSVRPGITCLWQIGGRSSVPFDKWMELDMEYIDRWSFWLDLKILVKTIPAVVKGRGAV